MEDGLWEYERRDIATYYPGAYPLSSQAGEHDGGWRIVLDPIPPPAELKAVISDLTVGRAVNVGYRGRIRHIESSDPIDGDDITLRLKSLLVPRRPYLVELHYPASLKGLAGPIHPRARMIAPEISQRHYKAHPHLSGDGTGDAWACPLSPHDTRWSWSEGATRVYLEHVALWLMKTEVWARTADACGRGGIWLGSAVPHRPNYVLANIAADAPCRCGSGVPYEACHRPVDQLALDADVLTGGQGEVLLAP